jgi:hypothetical protein
MRIDRRNRMVPEGSYKSHWACALRCGEVVCMRCEVYILLGIYVAGTMELHVGLRLAIKDLADDCLKK